jgi:hypothetical protein
VLFNRALEIFAERERVCMWGGGRRGRVVVVVNRAKKALRVSDVCT